VGGYANQAGKGKQSGNRHKETLFFSPNCRAKTLDDIYGSNHDPADAGG